MSLVFVNYTIPKLTEADILEIRAAKGAVSPVELARRFGVARTTIHGIWTRRSWVWFSH